MIFVREERCNIMGEKKRLLHVNIDNNGGNGAFALMCYLYSVLNERYIFDFFTMDHFVDSPETELICENGGQLYSANLRNNKFWGHVKLPFIFYNYLKNNDYKVIHIHSEVAYKHFLYVWAARRAGIKHIIIHAHSSSIDGNYVKLKKVFHDFCKNYVCHASSEFISISMSAANWLFTQNVLNDKNRLHYLTNGITPKKYCYCSKKRKQIRNELRIDDDIILIGHVGALKKVKNQRFLIEIFRKLVKVKHNYELVLVGEGEERKYLEQQIKEYKLGGKVRLMGARSDVKDLMQAFDVLVFPSFFEGVPMTLLEAQCCGMPIVASDRITRDIKINENIEFVSLESGVDEWVDAIERNQKNHIYEKGFINVQKSKYNIENSAITLSEIYSKKF